MRRALATAALALALPLTLYPLVWLLAASLRSDADLARDPLGWPRLGALAFDNFSGAFAQGFGAQLASSTVVSLGAVALTLTLAAPAAYALARTVFPGVRAARIFLLAGLVVPVQLAVVPLFFQLRDLSLLGTRAGLVLAYAAWSLPFAVLVLMGAFRALPRSLGEAARLDGASEWGVFFRVMLPCARPSVVAVAVLTLLDCWNEYLLAFVLLSGQDARGVRTLPRGLADATMASQYRSDFGVAMAGLVLLVVPVLVLYVAFQRQLVRGMLAGGVKG